MYIIEPDSTSQSILVKLVNSSTGLGLTGLTFETASLTCYYKRGATGASTAITLATQTAEGAYSSGGFVAIDGTYQPGVYRLDVPNAVVATGVPFASISFQGAANLKDETVLIQLLAVFDTSSDTVTLKSGTHTGAVIPTVTTLTGHTAQTGDSFARLGAPAGASVSADVAGVKTQTGAIETNTQDIQGRLPASLVSGRMSSDAVAISGSTTTADRLELGATTIIPGAVIASPTPSATQFASNGLDATDDHYKDRHVIFTSGALLAQETSISSSTGTGGILTVAEMTEAPGVGDTFIII